MNSVVNILFNYTGIVDFPSDKPLDDSLSQLTKLIEKRENKNSGSQLFQSHLQGQIAEDSVILSRSRPFIRNYFIKPIFYGHFTQKNGYLVLQGIFTMSPVTKLGILIGGLFLLIIEVLFIWSVAHSGASLVEGFIVVIWIPAVAMLGLGIHLLSKRIFRSDVKWISDRITAALKS